MCSDKIFTLSPSIYKFVHFFNGTVINGNGIAISFHVQHQVLTHYSQSNQSNVSFCLSFLSFKIYSWFIYLNLELSFSLLLT